jgi:hypothetical protein
MDKAIARQLLPFGLAWAAALPERERTDTLLIRDWIAKRDFEPDSPQKVANPRPDAVVIETAMIITLIDLALRAPITSTHDWQIASGRGSMYLDPWRE